MQIFDIHNSSKSVIAYHNRDITVNGIDDGETIDTAGFEALEFLIQVAIITDGTFDIMIEEGNDPTLSGAPNVSSKDTLGIVKFTTANSNSSKRLGYIGKKRFVRISVTSTGVTLGVNAISSIALLINAHHQPTD